MKAISMLLVLLCLGISCKRNMSPEELLRWSDDPANGVAVENQHPPFRFKVKYLSPELSAYKEIRMNEEAFSEALFSSKTKEYEKVAVFELLLSSVEKDSAHTKKLLQENQMYLDYGMAEDWSLVVGSDTLYCRMAHLEHAASLTDALKITLGFDTDLSQYPGIDRLPLVLYYQGPVSAGNLLSFPFEGKKITRLPHLTY